MWTTIPVNQVDRVEVVRGPFSALYGGNAMGGVVNVLTRPVTNRHLETDTQLARTTRASTRQIIRIDSGTSWAYPWVISACKRLDTPRHSSRRRRLREAGTPVTGLIPTQTSSGTPTFQIGDSGHNWFNQDAWRGRVEYTLALRQPHSSSTFANSGTTATGNTTHFCAILRAIGSVQRERHF